MGWFAVNEQGQSFEGDLTWGDGPADKLSDALDDIAAEFRAHWERYPTKDELRAGLEFALGGKPGNTYALVAVVAVDEAVPVPGERGYRRLPDGTLLYSAEWLNDEPATA